MDAVLQEAEPCFLFGDLVEMKHEKERAAANKRVEQDAPWTFPQQEVQQRSVHKEQVGYCLCHWCWGRQNTCLD
jgi:hypothetical protein